MALTKCKECGGSVSDAAVTCPHCGVQAPALTQAQKNQAIVAFKRAAYGRMGGWMFFSGILWLIVVGGTGLGRAGLEATWTLAKWPIFVGLGMYVISEIDRNLAERKQLKAQKK